MQEMSSPQFHIQFNSKPSSSPSDSHSIHQIAEQKTQLYAKSQKNQNAENSDPNSRINSQQLVFHQYETLFNALKSNEYKIDILNSNIKHLEKQFVQKDQLYLNKLKQVDKNKRRNLKTTEAIKAEKHRHKKLEQSIHLNIQHLEQTQVKLKETFEDRLKTQEHKNQIYQQYKDLEEEYSHKIEQLQEFFTQKHSEINGTVEQGRDKDITHEDRMSQKLTKRQILQRVRQENRGSLPRMIEKNEQIIKRLEQKLELGLENRQKIKTNIHQVTQSIKSLEHQQYQHQVNIEKLQKQKSLLTTTQQQVQQKNQHLNLLFTQVQQLKNQLEEKCEEKYGLVKYLKQVEKEEKNLRKLRKVQVQCSKEQALYRQQVNQKFAVLESQQDQKSPQKITKPTLKFSKQKPSQSPEFNANNDSHQSKEVQRFDTQTRQRLSHIIQKYQNMKSRRRN